MYPAYCWVIGPFHTRCFYFGNVDRLSNLSQPLTTCYLPWTYKDAKNPTILHFRKQSVLTKWNSPISQGSTSWPSSSHYFSSSLVTLRSPTLLKQRKRISISLLSPNATTPTSAPPNPIPIAGAENQCYNTMATILYLPLSPPVSKLGIPTW